MARSRGKIAQSALFSEVILSLEDASTATALSLGKTGRDPIHCLGIADNRLTFHAMLKLIGKEHSLREVSSGLNEELLSASASSKSQGYGVPAEVFKEMVKSVE